MKIKLEDITLLGVMTAIIIIMSLVPGLGFIPIGAMNATIVHIPVVIIAIVKGPKLGAILGAIFGISSMLTAILRPSLVSFIFINPLVSILPRVMIGIITGYIAIYLRKIKLKGKLDIVVSAAIGSICNTVGVLTLIYIIYAKEFMLAIGQGGKSAIYALFGIASSVGVAEMLVSVVIVTPISYTLLKVINKEKK